MRRRIVTVTRPAYNYGYPAGMATATIMLPAYYGNGYGYNNYCGNNTAAGAVVGGVAGALIGSSVADGGHYRGRYGYRHMAAATGRPAR